MIGRQIADGEEEKEEEAKGSSIIRTAEDC
jgi:hypothetical protein